MNKEKDNKGREPRRSCPKKKDYLSADLSAAVGCEQQELTSMVQIPLDEYRAMKERINQLQDRESEEIKVAISNMEAADKRLMTVVNVMGMLFAEIRCMSFLKRLFRFARHVDVLLNAYFGNANSGNYITRMKAEELGLGLRIELLEKFLKTSASSKLSNEEKSLLEDQRKAMKEYDTILSARIMFAEKKEKPQQQDPCEGKVSDCNPDPVVEPEPECGCDPYGPGCDGTPNK